MRSPSFFCNYLLFKDLLIKPETDKSCKTHKNIYDPAECGILTAEDGSHKVELKCAYQKPVQCTDYYKCK